MNYSHLVETTLQILLWSEEPIGLMRHIVYISHDEINITIEHKGTLNKIKVDLDDANKILDLICELNPVLGNSLNKSRYWMTIESPCLKLEYKWHDPNDMGMLTCNSLKNFIHQLGNKS